MNLTERRDRKLRQQRAEAAVAAEEAASDAGRDYFKQEPDLMLVQVCRVASMAHGNNTNLQIAFLRGYCDARIHHDAYKRGE